MLQSYPPDTSNFLKGQKNSFLNPVGFTILRVIENLFEELLNRDNIGNSPQFLDDIMKIKAVQEFTASQSIAFVFLLKQAIREELKHEILEHLLHEELLEFESKIDKIALLAFDIYMKCREKLYQLRVNELQNLTFRRLQRADLLERQNQELKSKNNETVERKEVAT